MGPALVPVADAAVTTVPRIRYGPRVMRNDVTALRAFYATGLGQTAERMISRRLRDIWPDVHGLRVMGLGFATPYLSLFLSEAERVIAVMPASQGVFPWPVGQAGRVVLADETALPFADRSLDRVLLVHILESSEPVRALMRDVWRVLADGGRLLVVVPNRLGIWARLERTPFGVGRPYTASQLAALLGDAVFTSLRTEAALFVPPSRWRMLWSAAAAWETVGLRWFQGFSGVLLVEAAKQIYGAPLIRMMEGHRRSSIVMPVEGRRWQETSPGGHGVGP
ncbi:MAG: SAM-dependent methyltransferase [Rhodospirillaceae bacterium]|nr:MAG: SAM-dependent methyltransferase [Rhodospirillaceae bacterium]